MPLPPHPLASLDQIIQSPSARDGLPEELEMDLRAVGCQLIQELGILVELPQSTLATAQVLLHRFFYVSSMLSFSINDVALASLYLSSKLCETPIRLRDLLNVYVLLLSRLQHLQQHSSTAGSLQTLSKGRDNTTEFTFTPPPFHSSIFYELKDTLIITEIQILKRLGFNMQVDLAYSHMVNYCKILDLVNKEGVVQLCWGILNDALQTPIYTHHPPPTIACFSILLATRLRRIPLPSEWWILFDAEYDDIWTCCGVVMHLWDVWRIGPLEFEAQRTETRSGEGMDGEEDMKLDNDDELAVGNADVREIGTKGTPIDLDGKEEDRTEQEKRWRRAWKLLVGKKYVRRWLEAEEKARAGVAAGR